MAPTRDMGNHLPTSFKPSSTSAHFAKYTALSCSNTPSTLGAGTSTLLELATFFDVTNAARSVDTGDKAYARVRPEADHFEVPA
jgi:hypothetical protein